MDYDQVPVTSRAEIADWATGYDDIPTQYIDPFQTACNCAFTAHNALSDVLFLYIWDDEARRKISQAQQDFDRIKEDMKDIIEKRGYMLLPKAGGVK